MSATSEEHRLLSRVQELGAELKDARSRSDELMERLAEAETGRSHTNRYWLDRSKELEAEVEKAARLLTESSDTAVRLSAKLAEIEKERDEWAQKARRRNNETHQAIQRYQLAEKERDEFREEANDYARSLHDLRASMDRARELAEGVAAVSSVKRHVQAFEEIARILSGDNNAAE